MPRALGVYLAAAVAAAVALSACTQSATRPRATATPAPTLNAPAVIATPTPSTSALIAPAAMPYAPGFRPQSFTAISETNYWVLGDAGCGTRGCPRILHTVDGGATFRPIATPPASFADINDANSINAIRFANANHGWAFAPGLWSTHDGGAHWKNVQIGGVIWQLEAAGGWVFATVGACQPPYGMGCAGYRLKRAPVGSDNWSDITPAGLGTQGPAFDLHQLRVRPRQRFRTGCGTLGVSQQWRQFRAIRQPLRRPAGLASRCQYKCGLGDVQRWSF